MSELNRLNYEILLIPKYPHIFFPSSPNSNQIKNANGLAGEHEERVGGAGFKDVCFFLFFSSCQHPKG